VTLSLIAAIFLILSAAELALIVYLWRYRIDKRAAAGNPLNGQSASWAVNVYTKANYAPSGQRWVPFLGLLAALQVLAGIALVCAFVAR
jgi:hypothetical protein